MDTDTIVEKLDILRRAENEDDGRGIAFEKERFLVSWVLLTRFPEDRLHCAWQQHGGKLCDFAMKMLGARRIADCALLASYLRIIAQVVTHVEQFPVELGRCLMNAWEDLCSTNCHSVELNIDMCNALMAWMEGVCSTSDQKLILITVWDISSRESAKLGKPMVTSNGIGIQSKQGSSGTASAAHQKMKDVLEFLLSDRRHMDQEYTDDNWRRLVLGMFELYGQALPNKLVRRILFWITEHRHDETHSLELKLRWHEWLLTYVGRHLSGGGHSTLFLEPKSMEIIQDILLVHIVSPEESVLRAMAWQTINAIVKSYGWEKCNKQSTTQSAICVWARLASGEWKIRLEVADMSSATTRPILDGCGRLMMSVVQYLVNFEERPDLPIPLDAEALIHIRKSLEETMFLTAEYVRSCPGLRDLAPVTLPLWSCLFAEIDTATSLKAPEPIIGCLQRRLIEFNDTLIMRDITTLLKFAESDEEAQRVALLLQDLIFSCLEKFWQQLTDSQQLKRWHHEDMSWACLCTQLLAKVLQSASESSRNVRDLTLIIFRAVHTLVDNVEVTRANPPTNQGELLFNLRMATESYITLVNSAGIEQTGHESRIVTHAIGLLPT